MAFVLLVASPLLGRLPLGARWVASLSVLGWFALVARMEPSVLRAVAMAGASRNGVSRGSPRHARE